ncbi:LLM class flavin-dependent oxidoreductase [Micromonospora sp. CPCC 205546]|uniref:LLM class flavin-dependent oxidoreductase n=1 Tax=Micromonospora sp. CPCC 205546 TaxID=3122397 RepID=UPI002FF2CAE8
MRLGLSLGMLHDRTSLGDLLRLAQEADRLGYEVLWVAEAYGSDAPTVLAWLAAQTERIDLGAAVMQIPARAPTMTAMTAATLDLASDGRFRLGLGISGPVVSEGWYGVQFGQPLTRTREYVAVVRAALTRRPVRFAGRHTTLPLPGAPGEPQRLTIRPLRRDLPVYLAALGPRNLELAGEIAEGSLSLFLPPEGVGEVLAHVATGRSRAPGGDRADFDLVATLPLAIGDDLDACANQVRPYAAQFMGVGGNARNFYVEQAERLGYGEAAHQVRKLFQAGDPDALAALPFDFLDRTCLLGDPKRIEATVQAYAAAGLGTLSVAPRGATTDDRIAVLREMAAIWRRCGLPLRHDG